ncbi:hypothetical protein RDI58_028196 [Solanum bulbocastanum]|uniref:Uncharacterized protein n=1 Tax=Solanum bulbocastanum TaxID=147425 RepID=A0AAN8SV24_SOLBU
MDEKEIRVKLLLILGVPVP